MAQSDLGEGDRRCIEQCQRIENHLAVVKTLLPTGLHPLPDSPGGRDLANDRSGPGGPWGEQPIWTYMSLAGLRLSVAGDHLGAMAKALMPPIPLYGPAALARMSLENSAHAFWLMDPTLSLDERIDRSLRQRLKSAQEEQAVARLLLTVKWKDTGIEEAIVKEAVDLGLAELKGLPSDRTGWRPSGGPCQEAQRRARCLQVPVRPVSRHDVRGTSEVPPKRVG